MIQPISQELFDELVQVWRQLKAAHGPFVAIVGPQYGSKGMPKLVFVGKATAKWDYDDPPTIEGQIRWGQRFYQECMIQERYYMESAFWRFIVQATGALTGQQTKASLDGDGVTWVTNHIAWTNLMKVAIDGANPTGDAANEQRDIARRILRYEMDTLAPDCVVILTNEYEGDLVWDIFGKDWRHLGGDKLDISVAQGGRQFPAVYHTVHPQGKSAETINATIKAISSDFQERWSARR